MGSTGQDQQNQARERLLEAALTYVTVPGVGDLGFRQPEAMTAWLGPLTELSLRLGYTPADAPAHARPLLAVTRGA